MGVPRAPGAELWWGELQYTHLIKGSSLLWGSLSFYIQSALFFPNDNGEYPASGMCISPVP